MRIADVLDIALVSVAIYFALLWLGKRASRSVGAALVAVCGLYVLGRALNMYLTSLLFQAGLTAALLALIIIFQEDLRRAFDHLAQWRLRRVGRPESGIASADAEAVVSAAFTLAKNRFGGLMVFKGRESLERSLAGGHELGGRVSTPLLVSIFHPDTPGHDGAVVLDKGLVECFGTRLPLSLNQAEIGEAGTRHAAALGLSERSDSLVIVVSEERGSVKIAREGHFTPITTPSELMQRIAQFSSEMYPPSTTPRYVRWITQNPALKLASAAIALALWFLLARNTATVNRSFAVPLEFRNLPIGMVVEEAAPSEVQVSLSGMERAFNFDAGALAVSVDATTMNEGNQDIRLTKGAVTHPKGLSVISINPGSVRVHAIRVAEADVAVRPDLRGSVRHGYKVGKVKVDPASVRVRGRRTRLESLSEIATEPLSVDGLTQDQTFHVALILPEWASIGRGSPAEAKVTVEVTKVK